MKKLVKIMAAALITTALFMSCGNPAATGNPENEISPDFKLNGTYNCSMQLSDVSWNSNIQIVSYDKNTEHGQIRYNESKSWIEILYPEVTEEDIITFNTNVKTGILYNYNLSDYLTYSKDFDESWKTTIENSLSVININKNNIICFELDTPSKTLMHGDGDFIFFDKDNVNKLYVYNYLFEDKILVFNK
ncbi:MAG: hypothetical protein MJ179_01025 [Treponema sp.]|nr:hypothetical protein [Treponema sp.]